MIKILVVEDERRVAELLCRRRESGYPEWNLPMMTAFGGCTCSVPKFQMKMHFRCNLAEDEWFRTVKRYGTSITEFGADADSVELCG